MISFRFLTLNLLSGIKSWVNPSNFDGRERLGAKRTTLKSSLHLHSLSVRLRGHKIKNFVNLMQEFLKKFDFFSLIYWENDLRLKTRLCKAASTCRAWPWGLEATISKITSNRCRFDLFSWIYWANNLRLKPWLSKAASTCRAWPWGLEATKSKISSNRCTNSWKSLNTGHWLS